MSFQRYESYKDSGVEWLGELPLHWEVKRIKHTTYLKGRIGWKGLTSDEYLDDGYAYLVTGTDFGGKFIAWNGCHCVDKPRYEDDPFIQLRNGDLLITKDGTIGKLALITDLDRPACLNSGIFLVRPQYPYLSDYLYWVLSSRAFATFCDLSSFGSTILHLYQNVFENFAFPIPTLAEQSAIVAFLDREMAKIDALVDEQKQLIELLREKRQALISDAVTKGLNPNAPMKPSGIEWIGDVPKHWSVMPTAYRYNVQLGKMLDAKKITGKHLRPYLRVFDVQWGEINTDDLPQMDFDEDTRSTYRLSAGDLLVNEGGSYPGRSAIWAGTIDECYYQKALHRLRPHRPEADSTQFFYYVMYWAANQGVFVAGGNETTIEHLPAEKLRRYRFAFPPISEQQEIASFLTSKLTKLDTLTIEAQHAIDLLQERRTALISAAVTGKIDVRRVVPIKAEAA